MPERLGANARRLVDLHALVTRKGRYERDRFAFEGPTLLHEARRSGIAIEALYATQQAYDTTPLLHELEEAGTTAFVIEKRSAAKISDLETPAGIIAVAAVRRFSLDDVAARAGTMLVLADVGDPGNAGTLVRSADAFRCAGVIFGKLGVEPYHPKVVRASMGSIFRVPVATGEPADVARAAAAAGRPILGLAADGEPLGTAEFEGRSALVVGHERRGFGRWEPLCERRLAIPISASVESLNAAVAGSIALYEAARKDR